MINKPIEEITEKDIYSLKEDEVIESKTIEYKRLLFLNTDCEKREFLRDVCSFANCGGGYLIIGIDEYGGIPSNIEGIELEDIDKFKQTMDNIILSGIEPNVSYNIKIVKLSKNNKYIILIKILQNWNGPFRVCHQTEFRFYSRTSSGKYSLDVSELRTLFNISFQRLEKIKDFREERISNIYSDIYKDEEYILEPYIVLHLIPLNCFEIPFSLDLTQLSELSMRRCLIPFNIENAIKFNDRWNFEGYMLYNKENYAYTQLYRNGILEITNKLILKDIKLKTFSNIKNEENIIRSIKYNYLSFMRELNIDTPILVLISLIGVKGYKIDTSNMDDEIKMNYMLNNENLYTIDRDILLIKETIINNYNEEIDKALKPCFDIIWNSCGFRKDYNYDKKNRWKYDL